MALLDFMLDLHAKDQLSMKGVQEEVDTFTFEVFFLMHHPKMTQMYVIGKHQHFRHTTQLQQA